MSMTVNYDDILKSAPEDLRDVLRQGMEEAMARYEEAMLVKAEEQYVQRAIDEITRVMTSMGATPMNKRLAKVETVGFVFDLGKSVHLDVSFMVRHMYKNEQSIFNIWINLDGREVGEASQYLSHSEDRIAMEDRLSQGFSQSIEEAIKDLLHKVVETVEEDAVMFSAQAREKKRLLKSLNNTLKQ